MKIRSVIPELICFRQWSRKKTAVLMSLARIIKICTLCLVYALINKPLTVRAQTDTSEIFAPLHELEEIEVIGQRNPSVFSEISRIVTVIQRNDIDRAGLRSFQDLLEYAANIDIRQRGNNGIQSDPGIRGGSFDHVLVLLNGINISDPQTGHVSLDLPADIETIDRIEVLQGSAARVFGPGALTGALNIVTKEPDDRYFSASQSMGEFGYYRTNVSMSHAGKSIKGLLSASHAASHGYAPNTDYSLQNIYYSQKIDIENFIIDFQTGYQHKKFGANGFYTPRFPNQFEEADVFIGSLKVETGNKIKLVPTVYWRRRQDHFILVRENPEFYQNFHRTNTYGSQLNIIFNTTHAAITTSLDLRSENIISNNLGYENPVPLKVKGEDSLYYDKHYGRTSFSFFQEVSISYADFGLTGGFMLFWNTAYPDRIEIFPGLDLSYRIFRTTKFFISYNRAVSLPTFTDLFYSDPNNQGNKHLAPNRIQSVEGGIRYAGSHSSGNIAVFKSFGRNIIDWLWSYEQYRFSPVNLLKYNSSGIEANLYMNLSEGSPVRRILKSFSMNYMMVHIDKSAADSVSKYYNLRHKLSAVLRNSVGRNVEIVCRFSYQNRLGSYICYEPKLGEYYDKGYKPFILLDLQMEWNLKRLAVFAEMSNMLNVQYVDAGSLVQPGRRITGGIRIDL